MAHSLFWSQWRCASLIATAIIAGSSGSAAAVETVRVETTAGVPRLLVDGQAVRARVFWGGPGSRPIRVGPDGQEISFEFSPTQEEPDHATLHFRFGQLPGVVELDAIQVRDLTAEKDAVVVQDFETGMDSFHREWTYWPPGKDNTVGILETEAGRGRGGSAALRITLQAPAKGEWPDFHIYHLPNLELRKGHRYRVSLFARAEPARDLTLAFYRPGRTYTFLGGPESAFESQIKLAADVGVNIVSFPVSLPWPAPGEPCDWSTPDAQCQTVLDANPQALLMPRIEMEPPTWWRDAHPDDAMVWDQGDKQNRGVVVASPTYRREAAERLAALVRHLEETFGKSMAGYHPCGQNTGEWFYQETWGAAVNGYAAGDQSAWRDWLKGKYSDDAALQQAWQIADITRDSAVVPSPEKRRAAPTGLLHDPVTARPLIDFGRFQQDAMAECVCQLARAVRDASQGRKLVVFFYGYVFEFGAIQNGPATAGHYALRRVLESPDIDVLCSPISYFDRGLGQSGPAMTAAESVALAGKMWLYEDDTRTYLGTGQFPGAFDGADNLRDTNRLLLRNTAQCALRNFGTWWMDLGMSGWFNDPGMWAEMERLRRLDEPLLASPHPFQPEVAAVIDEASMLPVAFGGPVVTRPGIYEVRRPLGRMGAPYGQYLQDDVLAGRVRAKLYVFLNAWYTTPQQRRELLTATRGSTRIWCYAPGFYDGDKPSLDSMCELTGFRLRPYTRCAWAEPTAAGRQRGLSEGFGIKAPVRPLFAAADATPEETLAVWPDGSAAIALRRTEDGLSLFVGVPGLTAELLRLAAREAGVHLFTETDCNVYSNGPYVALHAASTGPIEINTGRGLPITDLLTGEHLGQGPRIILPMEKGDTRILLIDQP